MMSINTKIKEKLLIGVLQLIASTELLTRGHSHECICMYYVRTTYIHMYVDLLKPTYILVLINTYVHTCIYFVHVHMVGCFQNPRVVAMHLELKESQILNL